MLILRHKSGDIGYTFWCIPEVYFLSIYLNTTDLLCRTEEALQPFFGRDLLLYTSLLNQAL